MFTSNYNSFNGKDYREVSISGDRGKKVNFDWDCYSDLAPKKEFWQIWHDNIGKISEEENNKFYVREYCRQVLSKLDPDEVYDDLLGKILLCYEEPNEFCHRTIVAYWFELLFGKEIPEIKLKNDSFLPVKRDGQEWIKDYLEEIIRHSIPNMKGFTSLIALRLYEKGEKYKKKGDSFYEKSEKMRKAAEIISDVDESESVKLLERALEFEIYSERSYTEASKLRSQADDEEQIFLEQTKTKLAIKHLTK